MWRVRDLLVETLNEARLPNSSFAHDQHHLSLALARLIPAVQEETQFVFATDERCQPVGGCGREPPARSTRPDYAVKSNRMLNSLERLRPLVLNREQSGDEMMHGRGYQDRVGRGGGLHPRGDVRHVAEHIRALAAALVDDDRAAVYPDPHGKPGASLVRNPAVQPRHRIEDR